LLSTHANRDYLVESSTTHLQHEEITMAYEAPRLQNLGSLTDLTLGMGGSTTDGNGRNDQRGGGNDGNSGTVGGSGNGANGGGDNGNVHH
jgi:hypothetical protein